ncbi:MAG TPA: response regulator receiver protein [Cyanobacteria bacterium UBA11049]|nr:response regulator receiver protein [Cyanobacteria bacterium UBA11049]
MNSSVAKILIVDDLPDNLRVLSATLTQKGYEVRCAKNGAMALRGARTAPPDLILLDVKMPDMNGYEVCQQLKASPATQDIPVIFMSALDDVLDKVKAFEVGGVDYIIKPFQIEEVLARIKSQLALQAAKAEICLLNAELEQRVQQRTAQLATANQLLQREIAERKQTEQWLQESETRLESILDALEEVVRSACAKKFKLLYLNPAAQKVYGRPVWEFFEQPNLWLEVIHPDDRERVEQATQVLLQQGRMNLEYRILRSDGEVRWLSDRSYAIYDIDGVATRFDSIIYDITERKRTEQQLIHDALHDVLTGLPNRTFFMERLEQVLKQAQWEPDYLFAVLFIDLDRFKIINDSLGHTVGDQLLITFAKLMQRCLRRTDTIARLGGDEFTILLENIEHINEAISIAERIHAELMSPLQIENHTIFTSASIGIVLGATGCDRPAELLRNADIAMYCAKEAGKARYAIFDQEMYARTLELLHLESDLRKAIERQEFLLHYQPIVSLVTGKLVGFEALIRWQHPERGLVSPTEFISIAEDIGLIVPIGEWVMHQACQQMREWQQKFPGAANLKISVNLASQQIKEAKLIERIDRVMAETGLDGSFLKLEITESMLLNNTEATINMLSQIRDRKIQLSIDDFGKGYSSLSYLHRFPINTLKIDGYFISQMNSDPENFEIVRTINTLAHNLGLDVTAECVGTATEFLQLKALGCEFGQGYFFSKPLDSKGAESLILFDPQW